VGEGVTSVTPGQPAMVLLAGGGYAERVAVDARHLMPIPRGLDLVSAAAIPEVFLTAWSNLVRLGGLAAGQRVLVHGGSGGVGSAAIQLACAWGAEVFATAGGPERCARCVALGATAAFDHRDAAVDFAAQLQDEGGVDVVLDVMGAKLLDRNLRALAPGGRLVVIGLQGGRKAEIDLGRLLGARLTVVGSTLRSRDAADKADLVRGFVEAVLPMFDEGRLRPIVDRVMPLPDADAAHRCLERAEAFGKIVLTVPSPASGGAAHRD
jgi:putative PIG3 family NAD(P)H quinone oxidoreductase